MISQNDVDLRICGGIAYLDANEPEWRAIVNWRDLDMEIPGLCILGQLSRAKDGSGFWSYVNGLEDGVADGYASRWEWARGNGFCLSGADVAIDDDGPYDETARSVAFGKGYAMLKKAWMSQAVS